MLDKSDHVGKIAQGFPSHQLHLDITLSALDVCSTMAFCAAEFAKISVAPKKISLQNGRNLWLRFDCVSGEQITKIRNCFFLEEAPELLSWTTTIGRVIPSSIAINLKQ